MKKTPRILMLGQGFIGTAVTQKLNDLGYSVEIYTRDTGQDILDMNALEIAVARNDFIIQMAAVADLNKFEADPLLGMQINLWGTVLCAQACTKYRKRLYNISTCCVYGNTMDLPSNEESLCNPSEIYAEAKLAGEHVIKAYHKSYGLEYVILRIATTYGPGMRGALATAIFLRKILNNESIAIHGTGNQTRTLTYIDDERDGIVAAINHPEIVNETINISSEEERSVMDLAKIIMKTTGKDVPLDFVNDRKGQTFRELIDARKAYKLLNWKTRYSLEEGIQKTFNWINGMTKNDREIFLET